MLCKIVAYPHRLKGAFIAQSLIKTGKEIMPVIFIMFPGIFPVQDDRDKMVSIVSCNALPDTVQTADQIIHSPLAVPFGIDKSDQV